MPTQVAIDAYTFAELSDSAKDHVRDEFMSDYWECDWWSLTIREWEKKLDDLGYMDVKIEFSGFYSQGDGASFTGEVDIFAFVDRNPSERVRYADLIDEIAQSGHTDTVSLYRIDRYYSHHMTVGALYDEWSPIELGGMDDLIADILTESRGYMREIYADLRAKHEYLCSDENIIEVGDANEWLFDVAGKFLN